MNDLLVNIDVEDLDAAFAFYSAALGCYDEAALWAPGALVDLRRP